MTVEEPIPKTSKPKKPMWLKLLVSGVVLVAIGIIVMKVYKMNTPPETVYTQAQAYAPMEAAAADAVSVLPVFPGFEKRDWAELPCSHNGKDDGKYTNIEIRYMMSVEDSQGEQVRGQYVELLREHWLSLGYEITYDSETEYDDGSVSRNIAAQRDDGISLWYRVWGGVDLLVQSGCVPVSDLSEFEYVPPAGGIEPGGENDLVGEYFPDGIPTEETSADAVAPFAEDQAVTDLFGAEYRAREYEL